MVASTPHCPKEHTEPTSERVSRGQARKRGRARWRGARPDSVGSATRSEGHLREASGKLACVVRMSTDSEDLDGMSSELIAGGVLVD